ncbi:MAG: gliding motility-associated C-terminal domain-containing protein [Sphingomonadales bacterium]
MSASPVVAGNTYLWSNGATTSSINVTASATITVTVTSAAGCSTTSLPTSVNVFTNPTATITATGSTTFCQGGSVVLTANAGTGYSYQWSNNTNDQTVTVSTAGSYTVTVTDANGCSVTSAPTVVTVNPLPATAAITGTSSVCIGGTTLLSTTATNPVWSSANTAVATVAANGLVTGVSAGTAVVSYTITNANGCTNTASVTVTVNQLPTAAIATVGATTFCQGGSVTLLASNAPAGMTYTYQWRLNGTAITGATANSYVATTSGSYSVTITTNSNCAATSAATTVTVNPLPVLAANTGATSVCENGTVTLANAQAGGLWSTANNTVATINAVTGVVTGINPGTTTLTYTFTNANGCTNSVSTNFTVNALPAAVITANGPTTFCQGASVTLTANAGSSYLWSTGATTQSITVNNTLDVTVTVTNANGCSATSAITSVIVNSLPVANITSLNGNAFCQGGSVTLVASTGASYAWSNGAITQSVNVTSSQTLTVTVTNANGCSATSAPFSVTMNPAPVATVIANGPTTFCAGGSVVLSAPAAASYLWNSGETTQTIVASVDGPYSVTITNGNGCTATSANTNITVLPVPSVQAIAGSNAVCAGSTTTLTNTTIGGVWSSNNAAVATIAANGQVTGVSAGSATITYTVTNANGCSNAVSFTINVNAATALTPIAGTASVCEGATTSLANAQVGGTWSSSDVAIATVAANGTVSGVSAGSVTITYTYTNASGCTSSVNQALVVNALPVASVTASGTTTFCAGGSVTLTAPAGMTYAWSTGESTQSITVSTTGSYAVTITNANGCSATSAPVAVTVNALPAVSIANVGATTFCAGGSVTLISPLNSTYNYAWNNGANAIAGASNNTYVASATGSYSLTVTDANGCTATSAAIPVTVNALPVVTAAANGPTTFCAGGSVTLTASGAATYAWSTGATTPSITVNASDVVTVVGTTVNGCSSTSNAITVTVNALPVATITSSGSTACLGSTVTLTANGGATYAWSNNATTPSINVTAANTYTVTVTSAAGCTSTASETVVFNANPAVTVTANGPTVFCQGGSLTLTATGGSNYVWSNGDQGASTTVNQSGSYFVTVTNAAGCTTQSSLVNVTVNAVPVVASINGANSVCEGGNMTLTSATPGGVWTSANNFIATIDGAGNVTGLNAGTTTIIYTVSVNGCTASSVAQINILNNPVTPTITASGATSVCPGGSVVLFASNAANYQWSNGPQTPFIVATQSGAYTVTATGLNGCSATSLPVNVFIGDNTAPVITAPLNVTVTPNLGCEAIGVTLGTPVTSDNCSVASVTNDAPAIFPIGTTTVTWTVTDGSGNVTTATQLVTVVDQTAPTAIAPANVTVSSNNFCEATGVDLGMPIATDNCTNNLTIINNAPATYPLGTTTVTWTITDAAGNVTTVDQAVTVIDETAPVVLLANTTVILDANGYAAVGFEDIDNGSFDNCGIASVVISQSEFDCSNVGNNLVSVTITDNNGNQSSAQVLVLVVASDACGGSNVAGPSVPDAFTPNGNNFNDTWVIPGLEGYNTKEMTVYSRYGTLVHYSSQYNNDWDGTLLNTGTPVPDGTYYYILNLDGGKQLNGYVYINRVKQ